MVACDLVLKMRVALQLCDRSSAGRARLRFSFCNTRSTGLFTYPNVREIAQVGRPVRDGPTKTSPTVCGWLSR